METRNCPGCGSKTHLTERGGGWTVDCDSTESFSIKCQFSYMVFCKMCATPEEAVKMWNDWVDNPMTQICVDCLLANIEEVYADLNEAHSRLEGAEYTIESLYDKIYHFEKLVEEKDAHLIKLNEELDIKDKS